MYKQALQQNESLRKYLQNLHSYTSKLAEHTKVLTAKAKACDKKEAAEADKRKKEMEDVANVQRLRKKKAENAKAATNTVNQVVTHDSRYLDDQVQAADMVNDWLMKQLHNDPRNHYKPQE